MNLLLLEEGDFIAPGRVRLTDRRFLQLRDVIGLVPGKRYRAGLRGGAVGTAMLEAYSGAAAELSVELTEPPPPENGITLVCALPRPQTFHKVLHCAVTMGVKRMYFIHSRKVEKSYWDASVLAPEAVEREVVLALEQCGDTVPPAIEYRKRFKPFAEDELPQLVAASAGAYFGHPRAELPVPEHPAKPLVLAVGPEGGFNDFEHQLLERAGMTPVSLGSRVLRTEFALAALLAELG
ncbi:MAG: 16S rRNA (uracil(1498)-N(3))-methyltransferase [Lentisphaeria bacterium]|nr:16S rRNA (uracil(1498)-N(3))-methyltransferase [Lentisphaeria bacterium]